MTVFKMADLDLQGKTVLIRQDLNVPVKDGVVTSAVRIDASIPTIKLALEKGAKVLVMSHLGRPTEGEFEQKYSMAPVVAYLNEKLDMPVALASGELSEVAAVEDAVVVLENVRFNPGEKANTDELAKQYAALCDVFVMDAFGTAHRAQGSTHGVAKFAPIACAGPLLAGELEALGKALDNPARPLVAVVGGSKVSTKLTVLEALSKVCDQLIVGGGISNTFVAARGYNVGQSLYEKDLIPQAQKLMADLDIPAVTDVRVGTEFSETAIATVKPVDAVLDNEEIMDLGPDSAQAMAEVLKGAKTILWNGPCGVFEFDNFAKGTEVVAQAIAQSDAFSVAGGGDTLAAIDKYGLADKISYISTGGGAFLEFVEGKVLPAVAILEARAGQ